MDYYDQYDEESFIKNDRKKKKKIKKFKKNIVHSTSKKDQAKQSIERKKVRDSKSFNF